ncbi:MAG: GSU2403 family nucleotidyltransferase fold protein [Nitrospirota bacterium]
MNVIRKTLEENYIFFIRELVRINEEIRKLPMGSISAKKIGKSTYYYHQWREKKKVKSVSLGTVTPTDLLEGINRRKLLERQRMDILDNIAVISKAIDTQRITIEEIIKLFSQSGIKVILIGSYCLPVLKENLGLNLPTIKTQDIDFLINVPYRGKEVDIESLLKDLGFSIGFNPDGSTYFTNGIFKVEFLTPEKGKGTDKAIYIKPLKIKATPLRYLQMLFDQQIEIGREGYTYLVPSPWVFAYHKILISKKRETKYKKEKDILQAIAILREVFKKPDLAKKAISYLGTLPPRWKRDIKDHIAEHIPKVKDFPGLAQ